MPVEGSGDPFPCRGGSAGGSNGHEKSFSTSIPASTTRWRCAWRWAIRRWTWWPSRPPAAPSRRSKSTINVQAIVEQLDPPRWPRLGTASTEQILRCDGRHLFGSNGLCGAHFAVAQRHHRHPSVKVICDEVRAAPGEVTIIATGPLSNIAAALQQQPDLASLIGHLIILGGTLSGPGNVTAAAEFNIYCDAEAARAVFRSHVTKTIIPIDLTSRITLNFDLLEKLPDDDSLAG